MMASAEQEKGCKCFLVMFVSSSLISCPLGAQIPALAMCWLWAGCCWGSLPYGRSAEAFFAVYLYQHVLFRLLGKSVSFLTQIFQCFEKKNLYELHLLELKYTNVTSQQALCY